MRKILLLFLMTIFSVMTPIHAAESHDQLFVSIGEAMMDTKDGQWNKVSQSIENFQQNWNALKEAKGAEASDINEALTKVHQVLQEGEKDPEEIHAALTALSSALVQYEANQNPEDQEKDKEKIKLLLPQINLIKTAVESGDFGQANSGYQTLLKNWNTHELIVRKASVVSYGEIEKQMAFLRIAITQQPPNPEKALHSIEELNTAIDRFLTDKVEKATQQSYGLTDVTSLLAESVESMEEKDIQGATEKLNELLTIWPMAEGEVQTKDAALYNDVETQVPTAVSLLNSKQPNVDQAKSIVEELHQRLLPLLEKNSYTAWDAGLIIFREGLEALLIIAALLAFLKKTNHSHKQKWIWSGVAAGVLASAILSVIITIAFSQATASSSREYIEGMIGIVAVVMMLTVAVWLHRKSSTQNWMQYIHQNMGKSIANGSVFSMALISFLSVFREGAETIIFYVGMAPSISLNQLLLGIGSALVILIVIGFAIIRYSVKLPIRPFFIVATLLIYFMSFKILGISIHALQIAAVVPTHSIPIPFIGFIGLYPSLEVLIPQVICLGLIMGVTLWIEKSNHKQQEQLV